MTLDLSKLEYVIFDWDNTLAESRSTLVLSVNRVLKEYGLPDWEAVKSRRNPDLSFRDNFPLVFGLKMPLPLTNVMLKSINVRFAAISAPFPACAMFWLFFMPAEFR